MFDDETKYQEALRQQGKAEIEIWAIVNEDGEYQAGADEDQAGNLFDSNVAGHRRRTFQLKLVVPLPTVTQASGELPEQNGGTYNLEVRPA